VDNGIAVSSGCDRSLHVCEVENRLFLVNGKIAKRLAAGEPNLPSQRGQSLSQFRAEAARSAGNQDSFISGHGLLHLRDGSVYPVDGFPFLLRTDPS
jgi:hypothetical protein